MEEGIFHLPAVADELKTKFIEARLHTDGKERLDPKTHARNTQLQTELAKSPANPYFVIYDPVSEKTVRKRAGLMFEKTFLEFLRGPLIE